MANIQRKWRSTGTIYIDSEIGSDITGNGSAAHPYQTYARAAAHNKTNNGSSAAIVISGRIVGEMADDSACGVLRGNSFGTAVFDGRNKSNIYMYSIENMIIKNLVPSTENVRFKVTNNLSPSFAGVGRANNATYVGNAYLVCGLSGSYNLLDSAVLYWGAICSYNQTHHNTWSRSRTNTWGGCRKDNEYKVSLGTYSGHVLISSTIYGNRIETRGRSVTSTGIVAKYCLFANFDMFIDDATGKTNHDFERCAFLSDCVWYYTSRSNILQKVVLVAATEYSPAGTIDENAETATTMVYGADNMEQAIEWLDNAAKLPTNVKRPNFVNCVWLPYTSEQVFNIAPPLHAEPKNEEEAARIPMDEPFDFTIRPLYAEALSFINDNGAKDYYGAWPAALNIPIRANSDGMAGTWYEPSKQGLIEIGDDVIGIAEGVEDKTGSICSQVIKQAFNGSFFGSICSDLIQQFRNSGVIAYDGKPTYIGDTIIKPTVEYSFNDTYGTPALTNGQHYIVAGGDGYIAQTTDVTSRTAVYAGDILHITNATTLFSVDSANKDSIYLIQIEDNNIWNALYIRQKNEKDMPLVSKNDTIVAGARYYNCGELTIQYAGRNIPPKGSFIGVEGVTHFSVQTNEEYNILKAFEGDEDSTAKWTAYSYNDEAFVDISANGEEQIDGTYMLPYSSGNYNSFWNTSRSGRIYLERNYIELKISIQRVVDFDQIGRVE